MNPEQYERVRVLYHELAELSPARRGARLEELCLPDELRGELEELLAHAPVYTELEDARLGELCARAFDEERPGLPAELAGFRVTGLLGRGGMGVVYRAEQERPRREVAIKVLASRHASPEALRRFEYEAEALARLDHPCVARVLQAGVDPAEDGAAYIVMELVVGRDLLAHCEAAGLGLRERVELLCLVCDGVEHAHRHGIAHRDLKPANILVSEDGRPRLLDFGIARPVGEDDVSTPGRTQAGSIVGSLAWMSPEQASGDLERLDLRTDVYSLGVLAYRLLCGAMPYDVAGLPAWEAARRICEEEPRRLGARDAALRGDLEAIVATALEKDPDLRYASAGALGRDLRRFLADEPVEARPWSGTYQLRKFARRHRLLVGLSGAVVLSLVAGLAVSLWQWRSAERARVAATEAGTREEAARVVAEAEGERATREAAAARREAAKSQRVVDFLTGMFDDAAAERAAGEELTVRQVLDRAVPRLRGQLKEDPLLRQELLVVMGTVHRELGLFERAQELLEEAAALVDGGDATPEQRIRARAELAQCVLLRGDLPRARELCEAALAEASSVFGAEDARRLDLVRLQAAVLLADGRPNEALAVIGPAVAAARRALPEDEELAIGILTAQYGILDELQRVDEAPATALEVLERCRRAFGERHFRTAVAANNLASFFLGTDREAQAEPLLEAALEGYRATVGEEHPATLAALHNLAGVYLRTGRLAEAERLFEQALRGRRTVLGERHADTLGSLELLGLTRGLLGRTDEGLELVVEAEAALEETLGRAHPRALDALLTMAQLLRGSALEESEALYRDVLARARTSPEQGGTSATQAGIQLGGLLLDAQRFGEAAALGHELVADLSGREGPDAPGLRPLRELEVRGLLGEGREDEARPLLERLVADTPATDAARASRLALLDALR